MDSKKFQIFVSSTYTDLIKMRLSLMEMIQRLNHFPVGMEQFSADDDEQWQIIKETLEQTDYYLCIVGHRYGSLSDDGRSYTEKEWDYAQQLGIPIMSFVRAREVATKPDERDSDPKQIERLDKFISKVKEGKMVDFWTDANDLNQKAMAAIYKAFSRKPRPGWIRAQSGQVVEQLATLVEENRVLRNQVEKLTSEIKQTKPKFEILINEDTKIKLNYTDDSNLNLTNPPYLGNIVWSNVPEDLREFITEDEVENYNNAIDNLKGVDAKVLEIRQIERIKATAVNLEIGISNVGTAKARQVYVELTFPESVALFERDEFDKIDVPTLELPVNPLQKAKLEKADRDRNSLSYWRRKNAGAYGLELSSHLSSMNISSSVLHAIEPRSRYLRTDKNEMSIWLEDLMHTREQVFREALIVPLKEGEYEISGTVICEELEATYQIVIPLTIVAASSVTTMDDTAS